MDVDLIDIILLEGIYVDMMKEKEEFKDLDPFKQALCLFPRNWYDYDDINYKAELLKKAIDEKRNLIELEESKKISDVKSIII